MQAVHADNHAQGLIVSMHAKLKVPARRLALDQTALMSKIWYRSCQLMDLVSRDRCNCESGGMVSGLLQEGDDGTGNYA